MTTLLSTTVGWSWDSFLGNIGWVLLFFTVGYIAGNVISLRLLGSTARKVWDRVF